MPRSEDYTKSSDKRPCSTSRSTIQVSISSASEVIPVPSNNDGKYHAMSSVVHYFCFFVLAMELVDCYGYRLPWINNFMVPFHFAVHKSGCHFESCCGVCNLFPGVLLIAFTQVLVGSVLLTLILTHGKQYDEMHHTSKSQIISMASGAVLTGVTGAGILLIIVALTENCRAMLVYLLVATLVWMGIMSLALAKIGRSCIRFKDAPKIKDENHRLANLACVSGLFTFLGSVLYLFSFVVVFSFYHFRYVRRAILLHEAECG